MSKQLVMVEDFDGFGEEVVLESGRSCLDAPVPLPRWQDGEQNSLLSSREECVGLSALQIQCTM